VRLKLYLIDSLQIETLLSNVAKVLGPFVEDIRMNFVKCFALYGVYHDKHM
jgi:hypothetical protein